MEQFWDLAKAMDGGRELRGDLMVIPVVSNTWGTRLASIDEVNRLVLAEQATYAPKQCKLLDIIGILQVCDCVCGSVCGCVAECGFVWRLPAACVL
jgi:hypothetical protein